MPKMMKSVLLLPVLAALSLAGPPGGGGHSSGGGGHMGGGGGGHAMGQSRGNGFVGRGVAVGVSGPKPIGASGSAPVNGVGSLRPVYGFNGNRGDTRGGWRGRRNRDGYYPGPFVMPVYGYGGYGDDSYDASYSPAPDYGNSGPDAPPTNEDALGQQVQQLSAEVQDLRDQQQQGPPQASAPISGPVDPPAADSEPQSDVPLTVVLHSGQQLQVKNYAVTDGVFWDFSKHPAQKIPLSAIDVTASEKATAASGGEFPPITP